MRLFVGHLFPLILLLLLNIARASAKINTSCVKVVTALAGRPSDLFDKFQQHICDRGCRPTVPHWDLWTRDNSFLPAVRSVMKRLDAPRQEEAMIKLGDDVADIIKRRCGPMLHGGDLCSDSETLAGFGNCFKKSFVRAALMNLPTLLPMVSEEVCREQYEYLKTDQLWEEIIPNNMKEYASPARYVHPGAYKPFVPPSPSELGKPAPAKTYDRTRKWLRRLVYLSLAGGVVYTIDSQFYASSLTRTARTFTLGLIVALDYKINFRPEPLLANSINDLHTRNAERLSDLLRQNGGLYLKIGQAIAMQSAILPPEFQKMFSRMFDDAPQNDWREVEKVIREDFGKSPEEVFGVSFTGDPTKGVMERKARASASVAQVHWARLADGREVAVKIQKREIAQQIQWDLWAFKVVTWIYSRVFDIPFYSLVPYVSERLSLETDFENEADNSEKMARLVAGESRLRNRVYIPKVYRELSSKRVMTAEWIEGVRLWDKDTITRSWRGGWRQGSPGCHGAPLDPPQPESTSARIAQNPTVTKIKPERDHWRGWNGRGGLGLSLKEVMTTMVDLFSAQMFLWGIVHCDPHPGNIFVRRKPSGQPELVLIDHGLYIHMGTDFRHQYARFWKALLTFDNNAIHDVVKQWGVTNPDIFASATLMRPYQGGDLSTQQHFEGLSKKDRAQRHYEAQQAARKGIRQILGDETKWPKELIFIGRNLRIVQANNQFLGSPVNRIKITGTWASRALVESPDLPINEKIRNYGRHLLFRLVLFTSDIYFYFTKVRQFLRLGGGMEDSLEAQMQTMARDMGMDLQQNVFEG
ncbi:ABC1 kinase family protein [Aspergillus alliaceus]|uniref:ABC1 kinase family protein n=1 Tax=Petromyces alliaceus TaxID=209559 RepID=UPI0012A6CA0F|nr:ABC1 family-domain-containing protein [Aspergillus alliaceus]KAB8237041.1 ABC1 family-domain-containing protein [Aspergillus alliaceus]